MQNYIRKFPICKRIRRNYSIILLFCFFCFSQAALCANSSVYTIDAGNNAWLHNNMGVNYMQEGDIVAAIKEFRIAIGINKEAQSTALYYNNLGRAYMKLLWLEWAQICFETAIKQDCMNFEYYKNLAEALSLQGKLTSKLLEYKQSARKNPFSLIMVGLIYEKQKKLSSAIVALDEFCINEPDLIITKAIQSHVKEIVKKNKRLLENL